jgi:glycosyltransferase involved in cell wall biosynthesis
LSDFSLRDRVRSTGRIRHHDASALRFFGRIGKSYTKEGFGIVFAEAATSSPPVIGCNHESSLDLLADGCIGRAIDPKSPSEILAALNASLKGRPRSYPQEAQGISFPKLASYVRRLVRTIAR